MLLVDTGVILAAADTNDRAHEACGHLFPRTRRTTVSRRDTGTCHVHLRIRSRRPPHIPGWVIELNSVSARSSPKATWKLVDGVGEDGVSAPDPGAR